MALVVQLLTAAALVVGTAAPAFAGPPTAMTGYVPLPSNDLVTAFKAINGAAGTTLDFTVGITNAAGGAVIYYDHWEDGYEADIANPVQGSTETWGDGNAGNGDAAAHCGTCGSDLLTAGDVFVLRNDIDTPRNPAQIRWDGRDRVGSTRGFALTAGGWTTAVGPLLASAVSAFDTTRYGTSYTVPIGEDTPNPPNTTPPFEYTSAHVIAAQALTQVQVDLDNNGSFDQTQTIGAGESMFVNGGLLEGARIVANKPVQVHLVAGDVGATYEAHTYTLFPTNLLSNTYINPVGSSVVNQETIIYLYNPEASPITITPSCPSCSGTFPVPAESSVSFTVPLGEAVQFTSDGPDFIAVGASGSQSGAGGGSDASSTYDWGFTLIPADILATQVVIGWAPGASDVPPSDPNNDPVWITTFGATTLKVDYDGDPTTGTLGPDCIGRYDAEIPVTALVSTRIVDNADNDMTGARIYTCDGTAVAGAWGEDPANAPAGSPGLDAGYTVIPSSNPLVNKTSALAIDANGDSRFGPNDTIQYSVTIANVGDTTLTNVFAADPLMAGLSYVPGSTTYDDGVVNPIADDVVPPAATEYPFDEGGLSLPDLAAGATTTLRFRVTIDSPFPGASPLVTNRIDVSSDQGTTNSTDELTLTEADLRLSKTLTTTPTYVGEDAVFRVRVDNDGPDAAAGVQVDDLLPAGVTHQSHVESQGVYDENTGVWSVGTIANGANATLDITARMDALSVTNYAEVTDSGAFDPDSQPGEDPLGPGDPPNQDDEDDVTVTVAPLADLSLVKTRTGGPDEFGDTTFLLTLTNDGPSTATGVAVTDTPPVGSVFVGSTPSQGAYDSGTGIWTVGSVNSGANATLEVVYTIPSFPATNFAQVTAATEADPDSSPAEDPFGPGDPPNEDDESSVTVTPSADLSLTKVETASPTFVGDNAVFDITVTNDGPDVAPSVQVSDLLPAGLTHVSDTPSKGSYAPGTGVWTIGAVQPSDSETLQITARVIAPGSITNTAEVSASGAPDPDSTPGNDAPAEDDQDSDSVSTTGATLGDTVFYDVNGDGTQDPGDPGIQGVDVIVTTAGANGTLGDGDDVTLPAVATDASGSWTVTGLGPGPYRVTVDTATLPTGLDDPTGDLDGIGTPHTADLNLGSGETRNDVDFGYQGTATVGDTVFVDFDGNGLIGGNEGIPGVEVDITWAGFDGVLGNGDDITRQVTTDATGTWTLSGLPPGLYQVAIDLSTVPPGLVNSFDPDGGNDATSELTLVPGANDPNQDFGFLGTGSIGRVIFRDDNRNGLPDDGEGIAGVTVHATWAGPDGALDTDDDHTYSGITDDTGSYLVGNLPAGDYRVEVQTDTLPPGSTNIVDPDGGNDSTSLVTLAADESNLDQNFGYLVPVEPVAPTGALALTGVSTVARLSLSGIILLGAGIALAASPWLRSRLTALLERRRAQSIG
ncbi:MAG TPA: SdrD B-like domain-containing protein [Acidimicrobiia bacterium]|nr:SdrD B-like domain-containing protein [Acidimicrobiia bacterium]